MVCELRQFMSPSLNDDVVSIAHVMEPAEGTIIKDGFVSQPIAVFEERIPSLLIVGNHLYTKRLVVHLSVLALV